MGRWTRDPDSPPLSGGNADVYKVTSESGTEAAQKVLRVDRFDRYDRFRREAAIAESLKHDHLCRILDTYMPEHPTRHDPPYLVMPWYGSGTLQHRVLSGHFTGLVRDACIALKPVAEACVYLHAMRKYHRDIKPPNLLLTDTGSLVLSDFGLCFDADEPERLTATLEHAGSLRYMAPEYLDGRVDGDDHALADVFALGKTLWAMLAGKVPATGAIAAYPDTNLIALVGPQCKDAQLLIQGMTSASPDHRMRMAEALEALAALADSSGQNRGSNADGSRSAIPAIEKFLATDPSLHQRRLSDEAAEKRNSTVVAVLTELRRCVEEHPEVVRLRTRFPDPMLSQDPEPQDFDFRVSGPQDMHPGEHETLARLLGLEAILPGTGVTVVLSPQAPLKARVPMFICCWVLALEGQGVRAYSYVYSRAVGDVDARGLITFRKSIGNPLLSKSLLNSVDRQIEHFVAMVSSHLDDTGGSPTSG